ncbi:GTP cyclohydrolase I [Solwaraspora sp. WMMD1047]|uniref:GTP cyclohydrolase I n=1 Tax=Solwaraspora sp. WMMD1047 TaxID=3016102 RepID=UPI0024173AF6|nr:GTP cyclohydrolase I [Solwaraspora sp. WMMD1047]MDG4830003.1 GTP cyclohydrolase I [Solwaraspora sp. WMMD1047]
MSTQLLEPGDARPLSDRSAGVISSDDVVERAAAAFLASLGMRLDTESTRRTAERMAAAYISLFTSRPFELTTFPNETAHRDLVLARAVPFVSVCAHHVVPFVGTAHVGYLPKDRIVGLSKLARLVDHVARGPQIQEEMTQQIAGWLDENLASLGVGVVVKAEHLCMTRRGVRAHGATTVTVAWRGRFVDDAAARAEFLILASVDDPEVSR